MSHGATLVEQLKQANTAYAEQFDAEGVPGKAGQRLLLLTCMDSDTLRCVCYVLIFFIKLAFDLKPFFSVWGAARAAD